MRIILSILAVIACIVVVFALPARFRKKLQRRIDNAISQSVYKQLSFLMIATGLAFGILLFFIRFIHGSLLLDVSDWLLAFINRGSSFTNDGGLDGSEKTWAIIMGVVGIIFLSGTLISIIGNIIERRVEMVKNGKIHYYFKNHDLQVDENGVCASEYDKRISASLPLIIRNDKRLLEYIRKRR